MIQIISLYNNLKNIYLDNKNIKVNTFSDYQSFDMYDINIINLNSEEIWQCDNYQIESLNIKDDLIPLKLSIKTCHTKIIIVLPKNYEFWYNWISVAKKFRNNKELKSLSETVTNLLQTYIYEKIPVYVYEKCETTIDNFIFNSDFYFSDINKNSILLTSNSGNKVNTIIDENVVITSLDLFNFKVEEKGTEKLNAFINKIYEYDKKEFYPDWINDIKFYNDKKHLNEIKKIETEIEKLKEKINKSKIELEKNKKIKGILYLSGNELNKEIINILEDILKEHNDFKDIFEEDYKFISDNTTFIVETKGLNNEVSGQNVTDAFSHLTIYEDKLEKENRKEKTKCLFFVASERKKIISERKKINSRQKTIAKRNNTLIIDTPTFLNIYEDFLNKKISKDEIIKIFKEQFGVISYNKRGDENND